jgi:hypothetical protein
MKRAVLACAVLLAGAASAASMDRSALGTSAAVDGKGRLWVAYARPAGNAGQVVLQRSDDDGATWQSPVRVNAAVEPVAAEGENRPKLAFGPGGEMYVTWTSPTSAKFTGDIRFARSLDGGKTWSAPTVVHHDRQLITHRFESLLVDPKGWLWVAWVDKRDLKVAEDAGRTYRGAAIYYARSDDRGATWSADAKLADSSCECCRIALASEARDASPRCGGTCSNRTSAITRSHSSVRRSRRLSERRSTAGVSTRARITDLRSRSGPMARATRCGSTRSAVRVARSMASWPKVDRADRHTYERCRRALPTQTWQSWAALSR